MDNETPPPPPPPPQQPSTPPPIIMAQAPRERPANRRGSGGWKLAVLILALLLGLSLLFNLSHTLEGVVSAGPTKKFGPRLEEAMVEDRGSYTHKIAVVPVEGVITGNSLGRDSYTMVDYIKDQLDMAAEDEQVKAVVLKVNSPGGEVLASDDIYNLIVKFQKETDKPVIASMGSLAASGGYYVSAPTRWIVANELTITGSIGVIMSSYNYRSLMDKVGVRPEVFKSGKFKDMLSGAKKPEEVTPEEKAMVQSLVNETFEKFKTIVKDGRQSANNANKTNKDGQGKALAQNWEEYADGRVLSGKEALKHGFIDELGNFETAVKRAEKLAGIPKANLVQYHMPFRLGSLFQLFGKSEAATIKLDLGMEIPRMQAGQLYFLSSSYVH